MQTIRSKDGTTIALDRTGAGPPVILVGGAFSWRAWKGFVELAELLSRRYTVLNYDRRAHGDSTNTPPYEVKREIEDLAAVVDAAGGSACVWGMSSGGILALEAARAGVAIDRLAAYEPPFIVDSAAGVPPEDFVERVHELIAADRRSEAAKYFMAKVMGMPSIIPTLMSFWPPIWSKLKATAHTLPYEAILVDRHLRGHPIERAYWADVATPTLVISGEKSPEKLRKGAHAIADALPTADHRVLAGVSHNVKMQALAPVLEDFFGAATPRARRSVGAARRSATSGHS